MNQMSCSLHYNYGLTSLLSTYPEVLVMSEFLDDQRLAPAFVMPYTSP